MWGSQRGTSPHGSVASSVQSQEEVRLQTQEEQRAAPAGIVFAPKPGQAAAAAAAPTAPEHDRPAGVQWGPPPPRARASPPLQPVADKVTTASQAPAGVAPAAAAAAAAADAGARPRASAQGQQQPAGVIRGGPSGQAPDMVRPRPRLQAPPPPGWAQQQYQRLGLLQAEGSDGRLPPAAAPPVAPRPQSPLQPQPPRPPLARAPSGTSAASATSSASGRDGGSAAGGEESKKRGLMGRLKKLVPLMGRSNNGSRGAEGNQCGPYVSTASLAPLFACCACCACPTPMLAHCLRKTPCDGVRVSCLPTATPFSATLRGTYNPQQETTSAPSRRDTTVDT